MKNVSMEDPTFERLQSHAKPLVDTIDSVISRALDVLEQSASPAAVTPIDGNAQERTIDPRRLPRLTHTKVLDASIAGTSITRPNWNRLVYEMLRLAMKRVGSFDELQKLCPVNMVRGRKEDEGYKYFSDIEMSVQGQEANGACRALVTLAEALGIALEIVFMWRQKEGADSPGARAHIRIADTASKIAAA